MFTNDSNISNILQLAKLDPEEAFNLYLPLAREIPENEVLVAYDPEVALHNVQVGAWAFLAHPDLPTVASHLTADEIRDTVDIAGAMLHASRIPDVRTTNVQELLARARKVRGILLLAAQSAASVDLVPQGEVDKIAEGRGAVDTAADCGQLARLFGLHAEQLAGKTVVTGELIAEAKAVGAQLLEVLNPRKGRPMARTPSRIEDDRNRFWTLLVRRHERMRRVAPLLFGLDKVDEKVPTLRAHLRTVGAEPETASPGTASPTESSPFGAKPEDGATPI